MKKRYDLPEENDDLNMVNEPEFAPYGMDTEMSFSPPLTEEELKDCITREELMEAVFAHIDELFDGKK